MRVHCEGCAGCCIDWRPLASRTGNDLLSHEWIGSRAPIDDTYNLVPLRREEIRSFIDAGYGDALTPRVFTAGPSDEAVRIDGIDLAAIDGTPVFYLGLRKVPKPVSPFGSETTWLESCVFLDPDTLQCRIHDSEQYPEACRSYPGYNLQIGAETECERVETIFEASGDRLLDSTPPENLDRSPFSPGAIGSRLFVHPEPDSLSGTVERLANSELRPADRAAFAGVAAGSSPGTTVVNEAVAERYRSAVIESSSWVSEAIDRWLTNCPGVGDPATDDDRTSIDEEAGAPATPGW